MHVQIRRLYNRKNLLSFIAVVAYFWFSIYVFVANPNSDGYLVEEEQLFYYENQTELPPPNFWNALFQPSNNKNIAHMTQQTRLDSIEKYCRKVQATQRDLNLKTPAARFYADERHKLLHCFIPKVAYTNLKRLMLILSGTVDSKNVSSISRNTVHFSNPIKRFELQNEEELIHNGLGDYKKFIFVRHPFERLVSAYYSKLARGNKSEDNPDPITKDTTEYPLMVGTKIIKKYRPNATEMSLKKGHDVTIPEFVSYVIDEWAERNKKPVDVHWRSQADLCHPCSIKYDIVGKFETMQQDVEYLLSRLGKKELIQFFKLDKPNATSSLVKHFLNQLTPRQLSDLYRIYKEDFKVFGYDPNI